MNLRPLWHSLHVRRWHTNPHLQHTHDTTTAHSARMAVLALRIWGDTDLACACLVHDVGECFTGDLPWTFKRSSPAVAHDLAIEESAAIRGLKLSDWLSDDPRVKLLDRVDAYLWMQLHRPDLMETPDWIAARQEIWQLSMQIEDGAKQPAIVALITEPPHKV